MSTVNGGSLSVGYGPVVDPGELLERLPVGTFVSADALRRWAPGAAQASLRWLLVGCDPTFDYTRYLRWTAELPVGVIIDPSDLRYRRMLTDVADRVAAPIARGAAV